MDLKIDFLKGKKIKQIRVDKGLGSAKNIGDDIVFFVESKKYVLGNTHYHGDTISYLADVTGDLKDLIDSEILVAEERTNDMTPEENRNQPRWHQETLWTYYELATIKGSVTLRFITEGASYYSVKMSFYEEDFRKPPTFLG